jgi:hypothetical protein
MIMAVPRYQLLAFIKPASMSPQVYLSATCIRAFLLATSAGQRARLMLPTGLLSGVELPVTSK